MGLTLRGMQRWSLGGDGTCIRRTSVWAARYGGRWPVTAGDGRHGGAADAPTRRRHRIDMAAA
jgi:hypothetical protein